MSDDGIINTEENSPNNDEAGFKDTFILMATIEEMIPNNPDLQKDILYWLADDDEKVTELLFTYQEYLKQEELDDAAVIDQMIRFLESLSHVRWATNPTTIPKSVFDCISQDLHHTFKSDILPDIILLSEEYERMFQYSNGKWQPTSSDYLSLKTDIKLMLKGLLIPEFDDKFHICSFRMRSMYEFNNLTPIPSGFFADDTALSNKLTRLKVVTFEALMCLAYGKVNNRPVFENLKNIAKKSISKIQKLLKNNKQLN